MQWKKVSLSSLIKAKESLIEAKVNEILKVAGHNSCDSHEWLMWQTLKVFFRWIFYLELSLFCYDDSMLHKEIKCHSFIF